MLKRGGRIQNMEPCNSGGTNLLRGRCCLEWGHSFWCLNLLLVNLKKKYIYISTCQGRMWNSYSGTLRERCISFMNCTPMQPRQWYNHYGRLLCTRNSFQNLCFTKAWPPWTEQGDFYIHMHENINFVLGTSPTWYTQPVYKDVPSKCRNKSVKFHASGSSSTLESINQFCLRILTLQRSQVQ